MDKTGWTTHCFGRFLIDLPPGADIKAGYYLRGDEIELLKDPAPKLDAIVAQRVQEKINERNAKTGRSSFIRRINLEAGVGVFSWESTASSMMYSLDTYTVSQPAGGLYYWAAGITKSREARGIDSAQALSRSLRSLKPDEIPTEPGFCIERAYIAGNSYQSERFEVGVTFPDHPGAFFSFSSSTGAEQDRLLDRVSGFLMGVAKMVAGIETLRKRERVGAITADEYLVAGSDNGQRVYTFMWEFQGKDESITEPQIIAGLSVLERDSDEEGKPPPPAFRSDKEALELWDTIIDSIRLRPVQGPSGPHASQPLSPSPTDAARAGSVSDDYALEEFLTRLTPKDDWMDDL